MRRLLELLPLQFRILYRQSLLRVIDLEALSIHADVPRFLGQFASILIFYSVARAAGILLAGSSQPAEAYVGFCWQNEQALISATMLVAGLVTVIGWDSTFPDRRDVMVVSPLPVAAHVVLFAKVAASASLIALAVLTMNFASGLALPLQLAEHSASVWTFFRSVAAYWFTLLAASTFLFCSVLTVQGMAALFLPRRLFLRVSGLLQLAAFALFLGGYFLQPFVPNPAAAAMPELRWIVNHSPSFWFFALFNQLNGSLPPDLLAMAVRAWVGLAVVILGAIASLLLCHRRTMKKTLEEPDLVPTPGGTGWIPQLGSQLTSAIVLFSFRSLTRSRQHRLIFAFYLSLVFCIALSWARLEIASGARLPLEEGFLVSTFMMMSFTVFGLRSVFALPISLTANWVLRITQLQSSPRYAGATRRSLLLLSVVPVWFLSALLSLSLTPLRHVAVHLAILALVGWIFVEVSLIGLYKVPFTCSYLPGKVHVQVILWFILLVLFIFAMLAADYELPSFGNPARSGLMLSMLAAVAAGLWVFNRHRAKSAVLYFEELPPKEITTLGLIYAPVTSGDVTD